MQPVGTHADGLAAGAVDDHVRRDDLVREVVLAAGPAFVVPAADDLLGFFG
jgi:hypothetical protein